MSQSRLRIPGRGRRLTDDRMKRLICSLVVVGSILTARAQGLPAESFGGALWGAMIGGILGGDCHHGFSGTGAAIGAGVGFLAGTFTGVARRDSAEPYHSFTTVSVSAAYPACGSPYVYYAPNAYWSSGCYYRPVGPTFAVNTTVVATGTPGTTARVESRPMVAQPGQASATSEHDARPAVAPAKPPPQPSPQSSARVATTGPQIPDAPRVPDAPSF
jgi:hypothetical protein